MNIYKNDYSKLIEFLSPSIAIDITVFSRDKVTYCPLLLQKDQSIHFCIQKCKIHYH